MQTEEEPDATSYPWRVILGPYSSSAESERAGPDRVSDDLCSTIPLLIACKTEDEAHAFCDRVRRATPSRWVQRALRAQTWIRERDLMSFLILHADRVWGASQDFFFSEFRNNVEYAIFRLTSTSGVTLMVLVDQKTGACLSCNETMERLVRPQWRTAGAGEKP